MINITNNNIVDIVVGSTPIEKAYIGSQLVWEKSSPSLPYDAEIEYIQGTGTQWIDTGYNISSFNIEISSKWAQSSATTAICWYAAQHTGYSNYYAPSFYSNASNKYAVAYGNQWKSGSTSTNTSAHVLRLVKNILYRDGTKIVTAGTSTSFHSSDNTLGLFNTKKDDTLQGSSCLPAKLYYFKLYEGGTLVLDLIPVRKDGVGYMYDRVSKTLFGNSGTGSFTLGPDVT